MSTDVVPTPTVIDDLVTALEPVRRALLEDSEAQAERIIAEATHEADLSVGTAEQEAAEEVRQAERRGAASAKVRADQALALARTEAHGEVLQSRDDLRQRLHRAARAAAIGLADDPRYPDLIDTLEQLARNQLGSTAEIQRDPGGLGGVVAVDGSRRVDYTLPALAERALESLADEVAQLWA